MSALTCVTCGVKFASAENHREHYKSDWHRYNLKRKIAELPSVTAEEFQKRVLQTRSVGENAAKDKEITLYCNACHKHFTNQKAYDNHLNSKKHKENIIRFESEHVGEDKEVLIKKVIPPKPHPAIATAAAGMGKFALASAQNGVMNSDDDSDEYEDMEDEEEEIIDDDLDKIAECPLTENHCLFCDHVSNDVVENLDHMSNDHSFFIPDAEYCINIDGLLRYLCEKIAVYFVCLKCNENGKTFYSLDAVRKHMKDKGHSQIFHEGESLAEYADYYDYSSSYPDHEEGMDIDEELKPNVMEGDEYQLVLPSGATIGHRSLLRYYKQNLNPERQMVPKKKERKLHKVLAQYRAIGWSPLEQQAAARKGRDIHVMKRAQAKWYMQLGKKANKLQKHYRAQVLF